METTNITESNLIVNANSIQISYNDKGTGNDPLIFIHGFPFDKTSWDKQLYFFGERQRTISYDIRGFGKSEPGLVQPNIILFAEDLIEFMNALEIEKATVCGLSMGGYILMHAVKNHPERFKALIFADTQCIADSPEAKEGRMKTIAKINNDGIDDFASGFLSKAFYKETLENNKTLVEQVKEVVMSTTRQSITSTLKALAERDEMCSTLMNISVPVLILCGDNDDITPMKQLELMNNEIPNSKLVVIKNAGHLSNLEQPEQFNRVVSDFIIDLKK